MKSRTSVWWSVKLRSRGEFGPRGRRNIVKNQAGDGNDAFPG